MEIKEFYEKHKGKIVRGYKNREGRLVGHDGTKYYVVEAQTARVMSDVDRQIWNVCSSLGPVKHGLTSESITLVEVDSQPAEYVVNNSRVFSDRFPHTCSSCGSPAYIGFTAVECSGACS